MISTKNKVRRQHYVWRKYLEPWTTNGKIWCRRDQSVFQTDPMNIAQTRDFYTPEPLTDGDKSFLIMEAKSTRRDELVEFVEDEIRLRDDMFAALKAARDGGDQGAISEVENLIHNSEEHYQGMIESEGAAALASLVSGNVGWAAVDSEWRAFIRHFATQYLRTKRIQENLRERLQAQTQRLAYSVERTWAILRHLEMARLAEGIYRTTSLTLLQTGGSDEFITSDQPMFNATALLDPSNAPTKPHLFCYPVSPRRMVLLVEGEHKSPSIRSATDGEVVRYNTVMRAVSLEQIYARRREHL
ncbi:DUF4238 domain-containing protein [Sorangium sp. So ce429]